MGIVKYWSALIAQLFNSVKCYLSGEGGYGYKIPEDWNSSLLEDQKNVFWKRKLVLNIITDDGNGQ
jgi:hypothetical protein